MWEFNQLSLFLKLLCSNIQIAFSLLLIFFLSSSLPDIYLLQYRLSKQLTPVAWLSLAFGSIGNDSCCSDPNHITHSVLASILEGNSYHYNIPCYSCNRATNKKNSTNKKKIFPFSLCPTRSFSLYTAIWLQHHLISLDTCAYGTFCYIHTRYSYVNPQ